MKTEFWKNKKVLVTGGTSGLGKALSELLTGAQAQVAVVARHAAPTAAAHLIRGDVGDKTQTHRIHAEALGVLGRIDILINNASALGPTPLKLLIDTDCEDFEAVLNTNLLGPFRLTKLAVATMLLKGSGTVINISSDAAVNAYARWGAYGASKAALDHLTRVFEAELAGEGIRFLALDPGDMDTPMHLAAVPDADRAALNRPADSARLILEAVENEAFLPVRRSVR